MLPVHARRERPRARQPGHALADRDVLRRGVPGRRPRAERHRRRPRAAGAAAQGEARGRAARLERDRGCGAREPRRAAREGRARSEARRSDARRRHRAFTFRRVAESRLRVGVRIGRRRLERPDRVDDWRAHVPRGAVGHARGGGALRALGARGVRLDAVHVGQPERRPGARVQRARAQGVLLLLLPRGVTQKKRRGGAYGPRERPAGDGRRE
mmetsp:Transcript_2175/g.9055  ORF Transcript_2175/g.9055 Transcript_2175/m.9055 type:complete len:213 (+) Transcript_2175:561-1199(+)